MQTVRFIFLIHVVVATTQAWKPIVPTYQKSAKTISLDTPSQSPASAAAAASLAGEVSDATAAAAEYKTTAFSLKQSHPGAELGLKTATSYSSFEGGNANDEDALYLSRAAVAQPITFEQLDDQYESYSLEDDYKADLLKSRTPAHYGGVGSAGSADRRACSVKKFAFNHDGIVTYDNELPDLQQFTMCFWMRFTNHSGDHVLLTYSVAKEPREIQIWVSNAKNSSFLSMAIKGQQMYRLNYPLRMRQWHHMCSSWNGKTGEWQVWLKAERIGRGFHNSLVGHKIPAKGKLSSGGPSVTGEVSQGLHFEVTLVQVYRIALSAGKAHRDHKHHHVHHFDHEGQELLPTTTRPTPPINRPQPQHNLLASGQIPTRVRINLAQPSGQQPDDLPLQQQNPQQSQQQQAITINTNFVNGQINVGSRLVAQQLLTLPSATSYIRKPIVAAAPAPAPPVAAVPQFDMLSNSANVQFVDETETRIKFKRNANNKATAKTITAVAAAAATTKPTAATITRKTKSAAKATTTSSTTTKQLKKRGLLLLDDGSVIDDGSIDTNDYKYDGLADFGGQQFKSELSTKMFELEEAITTHDREPAEEEVKAVMSLCGTCDIEPFQGAIVFAWKDVHDHMDNTLKGLSVGGCGNF